MAANIISDLNGTVTVEEVVSSQVVTVGIPGPQGIRGLPGPGGNSAMSSMLTTDTLADGDFVNVWDSTGFKVRAADADSPDREAHGFVLVGGVAGAIVDVYFGGPNGAVSGMTPGNVYLSNVAGKATSIAPTGSGQIVQRLGVAVSATVINVECDIPILLA